MEKQEFLAMFGIHYGRTYHGLNPVLRVAYLAWEDYEKSNFNEEFLQSLKRVNQYYY